MPSPAHRTNILNPNCNVVGIAVMRSGDRVYVTEDFAHRVTAYSGPEADAVLQRAVENYATAHGMRAPVRKPQAQLRHMAYGMALNDSLQSQKAPDLPGVQKLRLGRRLTRVIFPAVPKNCCRIRCPPGIRWELVLLPA